MESGVAATFRQGLELFSAATLVVVRGPPLRPRTLRIGPSRASRAPQRVQALSLSTLTQVHVWREVRTTGHDHEHDDYKARMHHRCPHLQQRNMC